MPRPFRAGAIALAVGSLEGNPVAAAGAVSVAGPAWRSLRGGDIDARIELDLVLRRSAEGGLALDASGRAIGMAVFGPRQRVLVIPAATIERVAALLESHGRVPRGYLGVSLQPVRVNHSSIGAMVMGIADGSPAAAAGLRQGDVILAWNGQPVRKRSGAVACAGSGQRRFHHHAVTEARRRAGRDPADGGREASRLNNANMPMEPVVIALEIADPVLSERLAAALADVPGVRVARHGEVADVALVAAGTTVPADADAALTKREFEVLALMAEGASNKAIARRLGISVHTAKFHVGSLIDKLDATGRTDAVAHAVRLGVIHL
ncbi:LuxR C-terminal-related transcriptional regulator [Polaromonas sp. P1(28)-13]|nr:LuxR C-terminal-related transcriptional regulator [Polaromonas sp. P1(28)-13]